MKTLLEEWESYRDLCYPNGLVEQQNSEVHQAFYAGVTATFKMIEALDFLPDAARDKAIDDFKIELFTVLVAMDARRKRN